MPDWSASAPMSHDPEDALNDLFSSVPAYEAVTEDLRVSVQVFWLPDQSEPDEHMYCWVYRIRIENAGKSTVQLTERTWHITDASGRTEYVHGEGVVGEQPVIRPQNGFDYTSGVSLTTAGGFMRGSYQMRDINSGRRFDVTIPAFSLDSPFQIRQIH
ncbi:Co2+/Mg2+ efflux protein ApaG [Acetobacter indonesiensis]|uniref:Protein ApaG n=1 Tax=Acetobacter indonesiensis TaxID=104101 RepID=A0A252AYJ5_9PROT|nr:Co2+/Mg2+ efflux protein ApaG [Acetobacter indonesiensis]MCI1438443.1 Co2+/Mg2+ efflux protein ApaG [Acetobacter indonesiensis]MCI1545475.1 Co2+/Mg2+ efflux protein ApaG [Acetobacter indonesiensis]MCI1764788.1 Co2+/Mg2+ efflux protein ApaG [Acetobacter indonesiensis]MCP1231166.1 Co2+/Mg2+ efflux protein ApaG [Acetobacter indonesiensis]OUI96444.1 magnesium transporter [Acetobacter indonesiensis]